MKADIEIALAAAKAAGTKLFLHTYAQVGGEFDPADLTVGEKGLISRAGAFIPYKQVASLYPVDPAAKGRGNQKERK